MTRLGYDWARIADPQITPGSFRYLHSRTTKDPDRRALVDPNTVSANHVRSARLPATEEVPDVP